MLEALEAFGPAAFFRTSIYLYPAVNLIHVLAIGALITSALLMDLRVLGVGRGLPVETVVRYLRPVAITAIFVAVLAGLTLFSVQPVDYWANPAFRIKMIVLPLAVLNAAAFTTFRAHRHPERAAARVMAVLSIVLWVSVAFAGRMIGFVA
jgi:hypothetical protein